MKKLLLLILTMVMVFSITGCGGTNNDENNAAIQAKIDEADGLVQEITSWYVENGYLEGDDAAQMQEVVDSLTDQMETIKEAHQENMDSGGYSDSLYADKSKNLDELIVTYKEAQEELLNYENEVTDSTAITVLTEKYNELVTIVNETSALATANGWDAYEAFTSELEGGIDLLTIVGEDIQNPDTMDEEYMNILITSLDEMLLVWQDYYVQVSETYIVE